MGSEAKAKAVEPEQRRGPEKKKVHALLCEAGLVPCAHSHCHINPSRNGGALHLAPLMGRSILLPTGRRL